MAPGAVILALDPKHRRNAEAEVRLYGRDAETIGLEHGRRIPTIVQSKRTAFTGIAAPSQRASMGWVPTP